jgi:cation transport ATPase
LDEEFGPEPRVPLAFDWDSINDAPALMSATVGVAIGQNSDITTESDGFVILDSSSAGACGALLSSALLAAWL